MFWVFVLCCCREKSHMCLACVWLDNRKYTCFKVLLKHISHERAPILLRQLGNEVIILNWSRGDCWTYFSGTLEINTNSNEKSFNEIQSGVESKGSRNLSFCLYSKRTLVNITVQTILFFMLIKYNETKIKRE